MPKYYILPQVDGASERRKAKKREKQKKKKKKQGNNQNQNNSGNNEGNRKGEGEGKNAAKEENQEQKQKQEEGQRAKGKRQVSGSPYSPPESFDVSVPTEDIQDQDRDDDGGGRGRDQEVTGAASALAFLSSSPLIVDGSVVSPQRVEKGSSAAADDYDETQLDQNNEYASRMTSSSETLHLLENSACEMAEKLHCQVHGRPMCQFNPACCVHKPVADCGCPPNRSCCCVHHSGDCCACLFPSTSFAAEKAALVSVKASIGMREDSPIQNDVGDDDGHENREAHNEDDDYDSEEYDDRGEGGDADADAEQEATEINLTLSNYLIGLLERSELCDFRIVLRSSNDLFWPLIFPCHKILLARSPLLRNLLRSPRYQEQQAQGQHGEMIALAGDHFCIVKSFELVLQHIYGRPLLRAKDLRATTLANLGYDPALDKQQQEKAVYPFSLQAAMVDLALCYASCGAFFHLSNVVETGFALAIDLLSWDTVEVILYFGVNISQFAIFLDVSPSPLEAASVDKTFTSPPSENSQGEEQKKQRQTSLSPVPEIQLPWSPHLITAALAFIIDHVTADFPLYASAQGTSLPDRIPESLRFPSAPHPSAASTAASDSAANSNSIFAEKNPQLATVKFGSLETEQERTKQKELPGTPGPEIVVPSAVLIGLPFLQLQVAFAIMTNRRVLGNELARAVVVEREARRVRALKAWRIRVANSAEKVKGKEKDGNKNDSKGKKKMMKKKKETENDEGGGEVEVPDSVRELGYREFFTSKVIDEIEMEITLEREWVGLEE